jgi:hypothetical protein
MNPWTPLIPVPSNESSRATSRAQSEVDELLSQTPPTEALRRPEKRKAQDDPQPSRVRSQHPSQLRHAHSNPHATSSRLAGPSSSHAGDEGSISGRMPAPARGGEQRRKCVFRRVSTRFMAMLIHLVYHHPRKPRLSPLRMILMESERTNV